MKILLDENLPQKLVAALRRGGYEVESVHTLRLQGLDNGKLYDSLATALIFASHVTLASGILFARIGSLRG